MLAVTSVAKTRTSFRPLAKAPACTRVVIVDDKPMVREGIQLSLRACSDVRVIGTESSGLRGAALVEAEQPELVILDLALPDIDGVALLRRLSAGTPAPPPRLLVLTVHDRERDVVDAFMAGATGYALQTEPIDSFVRAVLTVAAGRRYVAPSLRAAVLALDRRARLGGDRNVLLVLSIRERQVFKLAVSGASNRQIAAALNMSVKTVDTHRLHVNQKLGCHCNADLVRFAVLNELATAAAELPPGAFQQRDNPAGHVAKTGPLSASVDAAA